jgi:hypothetical protein
MRKLIMTCATVLAVALGVPAVAEAHHIDHTASNITCVLVNGTPTIQTTVAYRQFADYDKPVQVVISLNGTLVFHDWITWTGSDYNHTWSKVVAPGGYDVHYWAGWLNNSVTDEINVHVNCPAPPTPPTPPTPPVTPPSPPVTPPSPPVTPPTPPVIPPHHKCIVPKIKVTVTPKHQLHGLIHFHVKVTGGTLTSATWYVRRNGKLVRHGHSGKPWEWTTAHGANWYVYLWVESVWGYPQWGMRTGSVHVNVKTACGTAKVAKHFRYMNHDPEPRARHWESTTTLSSS